MPRHAGPYDVAYLRRRAWRPCGLVLRRHAVQRGRRQLPQWRSPERALQHLCGATLEAAGRDADLSRPRLHRAQSRFHLDREPDNASAKAMLPKMEQQDTTKALVTTLSLEREINTFFRLTSPSVIRRLRETFPDLPDNPDPKTVFLKLRELRNKW